MKAIVCENSTFQVNRTKDTFLKEKQRLTSSNRLYTCEVRQNKNVFDLLGEMKEENKALLFFSSGEAN